MPTAVAAVVAKVASIFVAFGASAATAATLASFTVKAIAYLAIDAVIRKVTSPDFDKGVTGANYRTENIVKGATEARNIVYGELLVGGILAYANTAGASNKDLWYVIAHAGHEIEDITDMYFDEVQIGSANISWNNAVTGGDYFAGGAGYVTLYKKLGTSTQSGITDLDTAFPDITTAHDGRGIAHTAIKLTIQTESEKMFERGAPRNIKALVQGKNDIYDPRLDTSPGANPTNATYQAYTTNPVLIIADYLRDTVLGMSVADARIDWDAVENGADFCDQLVPTDTATETEKRYTASGMLLTSTDHGGNIRTLLTSCNGSIAYKSGQFVILPGQYGTGANLCTNGHFDTAVTGWFNGIPSRGTVARVSTYGGGLLVTNIGSGFARATYPITTVVGNTYVFQAQTKTAGADTGYLFGASNNSDGSSPHTSMTGTEEDGVYSIEFVATATTTYIVCLVNNGTLSKAIIWDNVSAYLVASRVINEDWLRGDLTMQTASPKASRFNTASAFYRNRAADWKKAEALPVTNTAFVARDNGETLRTPFDLPFTDTETQAQRLLHKLIQGTDEQKVINLPCNYKALNVSVHDRVMITIGELSWTNKIFRVIDWLRWRR